MTMPRVVLLVAAVGLLLMAAEAFISGREPRQRGLHGLSLGHKLRWWRTLKHHQHHQGEDDCDDDLEVYSTCELTSGRTDDCSCSDNSQCQSGMCHIAITGKCCPTKRWIKREEGCQCETNANCVAGLDCDNNTCSFNQDSTVDNAPLFGQVGTGGSIRGRGACQLPVEQGHCKAFFKRFAFSGGACHEFIYGGCEGNSNNFKTLKECKRTCATGGWFKRGNF